VINPDYNNIIVSPGFATFVPPQFGGDAPLRGVKGAPAIDDVI
jgi:hypothetical protein